MHGVTPLRFIFHEVGIFSLYYKGQKTVYFLQVYDRKVIQALKMSLL